MEGVCFWIKCPKLPCSLSSKNYFNILLGDNLIKSSFNFIKNTDLEIISLKNYYPITRLIQLNFQVFFRKALPKLTNNRLITADSFMYKHFVEFYNEFGKSKCC